MTNKVCLLERTLKYCTNDERVDQIKAHLSRHYHFYKIVSVVLIAAGIGASLDLGGRSYSSIFSNIRDLWFESRVTVISVWWLREVIARAIGKCLIPPFEFLTRIEKASSAYVIKGLTFTAEGALLALAL